MEGNKKKMDEIIKIINSINKKLPKCTFERKKIVEPKFGKCVENIKIIYPNKDSKEYSYIFNLNNASIIMPYVNMKNDIGRVMIISQRRPIDCNNNLSIEFPAGGVEENESFYIAAKKELSEELGLDISKLNLKFIQLGNMSPDVYVLGKQEIFLTILSEKESKMVNTKKIEESEKKDGFLITSISIVDFYNIILHCKELKVNITSQTLSAFYGGLNYLLLNNLLNDITKKELEKINFQINSN